MQAVFFCPRSQAGKARLCKSSIVGSIPTEDLSKEVHSLARSKATFWLTEESLEKVEGWAREGKIDREIAQEIGISTSTFYNWTNKYVEFLESINRGRKDSRELAEKMVFEHIRGFEYEETDTTIIRDNNGNEQRKVTKKQKKSLPNDRMLQFYLRNRYPDSWNGKGTIELERLQLENAKLKQQLEEAKSDNGSSDIEEQRLAFKAEISNVMVGYIERLEGWFNGEDEN